MSGNNLFRKAEFVANVSIAVVAFLLSIVLVKSYLLTKSSPPAPDREAAGNEIRLGRALAVPGVDWAKNGLTLVLALSTTCHFCTDSGPFYQRVAKERGGARLVALVPQSVEEGWQYLKKLGVEVSEVKQVPMGALGLTGTPTLILVDGNGTISNFWVGKLSQDGENDVLNYLQLGRAGR